MSLDPTLLNARLYLATAYAQQYIPGADTEDNNKMGESAIDQYKAVLESDPKNINSVKGIAYLYLQMKRFEDAKTFYRKANDLDPNDPEPYYSVAVIDWTQSYQPRMEERAKVGLKPDEWIMKDKSNKKVCQMLRDKNTGVIDDGITMLKKALDLRPDYDDAMAYLNLLYREKGDLECDDPGARAADLKTADEWVDKTMTTKEDQSGEAAWQPGHLPHAKQLGCFSLFRIAGASSSSGRGFFCEWSGSSVCRCFWACRSSGIRFRPCTSGTLAPTLVSMFKKILVANRGEIAVRVIRACREMGIASVAVYSDVDRASLHVLKANQAYGIGPAPAAQSYLNIEKILDAAKRSGADAIHPGYGFLSENAKFAQACAERGIKFIGPNAASMEMMGSKTRARQEMEKAGVPFVPGTSRGLESVQQAREVAEKIGYPVMLKAAAGGGGKGMRLVNSAERAAIRAGSGTRRGATIAFW